MKIRWIVFLNGLIFIKSGIKIILSAMFENKGLDLTIKSLKDLDEIFTVAEQFKHKSK